MYPRRSTWLYWVVRLFTIYCDFEQWSFPMTLPLIYIICIPYIRGLRVDVWKLPMSHMQGYLKNDKTNILPLVHPTIFPIFHPVDYYFFTIICLNCTPRLPWYCQSTKQVTVVLAVNPDERHLRPSCRRPELEAELIDLTMVTDHAPLPISAVGTPPRIIPEPL